MGVCMGKVMCKVASGGVVNGGSCGGRKNKRSVASHLCESAAEQGGWARWVRPRPVASMAPPQKAPTRGTVMTPAVVASSLKPPEMYNVNIM